MSALVHCTDCAHDGGVDEDVTVSHCGSPERERDVTDHPRVTADLQIREPARSCQQMQ